MFHAKILCQNLGHSSFWKIPRSASSSHTVSHQSLLIAAPTCSTFSGVLLAAGLPDRGSLSSDSWPSLKWSHFYLHCTHCIISKSLLNYLNGFHKRIFKLHAKFDADALFYSLRHLNVMATQYTCSLNGVYHPHWLVQWGHHCSHMCIPVHSPWLPGNTGVVQTVLVTLTVAGLFPDRRHILRSSWKYKTLKPSG